MDFLTKEKEKKEHDRISNPYIVRNEKPAIQVQTGYTNPNVIAFVSLLSDLSKIQDPNIQSNPIGLVVIQLVGANAEEFLISQLSLLPCDKERLINGIITINKSLPFKNLYLDLETYKWLDADRSYSSAIQNEKRKQENLFVSFPTLKAVNREKDLLLRQMTVLTPILNTPNLTLLPAIQANEHLIKEMKNLGSSLADALAGAIEQCKLLQREILIKLQKENQEFYRIKKQFNI